MNTKTDGISSVLLPVVATDHPDIVGGIVWSRCELDWINNRLSDAEAIIAEKDADIRRLKAMLPAIPRRERECKTLEDWKCLALYYESQWANCSYGFNLHAGKQAERIKELEAEMGEEEHIRDRVSQLLAETAVALKGPEKALHRHGWQDLPDIAAKQSAALKLARKAITNELQPCGCANGCSFCAGKVSLEQALAAIDAAMQEDKP